MRTPSTPERRKEQSRADQARYRARHPEERRRAARAYNAKRREELRRIRRECGR